MKIHACLIDFAHFRENCPTGIIPEGMQKVTQHNGIMQCCIVISLILSFLMHESQYL